MKTEPRPELAELKRYAGLIQAGRAVAELNHEPDLIDKLDYHGIALLALEQHSLPVSVTAELSQRRAMMVANEQLKKHALQELFAAFDAAGLNQIVLFKGSALAYSVYPQAWLRPRSDSDCLIDKQQLPQFAEIFYQLGYQKLFAIEGQHIHYQSTFSKALAGKSAINIDLHWQINNRQILAQSYQVEQLLADGGGLPNLSSSIRIPHAVDSLLIASLHRLGHHVREERLTWIYDVHLLASTLTEHDWLTLLTKSKDKKLAAITLDALQLSHELFNTPLPQEAIQQLSDAALLTEPSQLFLNRELSEWQYFWHDLKALPSNSAKLQAIWENIMPSPSYVKRQMGTQWAVIAYAKRFIRGIKRLASR